MPVEAADCTPYLSGVLFRSDEGTVPAVQAVRDAIKTILEDNAEQSSGKNEKSREFLKANPDSGTMDGLSWALLHYSETRSPPWYAGDDVKDTVQNLVVVSSAGNITKLAFSDNAVRNLIVREIRATDNEPLGRLKQFTAAEIKKSLVADSVRTLWLSGTHRQSVVKADSKTLSGLQLEFAVDPLTDQSYFFSSIRSTIPNTDLTGSVLPAIIGTSPQHARFWLGPTRDWDEFIARTSALLAHVTAELANTAEKPPVLSMLAQPGGSIADVSEPYDVSLIVPEAQFPDAAVDQPDEWLQQFADTVRFEIETTAGSPDFDAIVFWGAERLGQTQFRFEAKPNGENKLVVSVREWEANDAQGLQLIDICTDVSLLTVYFDTGHAYARGQLYETPFRDPKFSGWDRVPMAPDNTAFHQEKPTNANGRGFDVAAIGTPADSSLFGLVARHWPNLKQRGQQTGWLICDDGSMESADFIHIDDATDDVTVSLIHVKGSSSDSLQRGISVTDYEVVVGQAVKNLRYLERTNLHSKLSANKDSSLRDAVWRNGVRQNNRDEVLEFVNGIGSSFRARVYVLQPRVRKSAWQSTRTKMQNGHNQSNDVLRLKQLETLLQGASTDCHSLGAEFVVIADADA